MKYMGSKARIAKYLLPIILRDRKPSQYYVEPFVGGANMIDKVDGLRIGADSNKSLISALELIRDNPWFLPKDNTETNEADYKKIKIIGDTATGLHGYYGFALSYGGKWFGGWCRDSAGKRDYVKEAYNNAIKQSPKLSGVNFINSSYIDLDIPDNSIIYCDPPYKKTTKYKKGDFDHEQFFMWCEDRAREGHSVFISEYSAPKDFICIWEKEIVSSLTKNTGAKKGTEKLFVHESQYNK